MNDAATTVLLGQTGGEYVFTNLMTGCKFKDVKGSLLAAVKKSVINKVTWHMFRHTFATRLLRIGVDIVTAKELLGHSNINLSMRYAHANENRSGKGWRPCAVVTK